jgi:prevent-host-death family protein
MTVTEVKAKLLALLDEVEHGEEIEITRHGRTIARLSPARGPSALRGMLSGIVRTTATDEELFSTGESWEILDDDTP